MRGSGKLKRNLKVAAIQTAIFAVVCVLMLARVGTGDYYALDFIDGPFLDKLFLLRNRVKPEQPISDQLTLIGIDDLTARRMGPFGKGVWVSRKPFVDQARYFHKIFNPKVVAYDLLLPDITAESDEADDTYWGEPERFTEMHEVIRKFSQEGDIDRERAAPALGDMARFVGYQGNVALSHQFDSLMNSGTSIVLAWSVPMGGDMVRETLWNREDILGRDPEDLSEDYGLSTPYLRDIRIPLEYTRNLPDDFVFNPRKGILPSLVLRDYAALGTITVPRDRDGIIRRYPLVHGIRYSFKDPQTGNMVHRRFLVPSFALVTCLKAWGLDLFECNRNDFKLQNGKPLMEVDFGNQITVNLKDGSSRSLPIDKKGRIFLDFTGDFEDFAMLPFVAISPLEITQEVNGNDITYHAAPDFYEKLNDKIVMIGLTATGSTDIGPTPINDKTPFVHVHMIATSNILTKTFIHALNAKKKVLLMLVLWLVLTPLAFISGRIYAILMAAAAVGYGATLYYGIHTHQWVLPFSGPFFFIAASYLTALFVHYLSEERERKRIRGMFSTMVSGDVLQYMERNPGSFSLAGEAREATMFFSDVAGFTTISESLAPEQLVLLLNAYLTPMTEIIMQHNGYVDKYEGDAIMAEWGVPFPNAEHAVLACYAALDQQKRLAEIRPELEARFGHRLFVRMGLNSGVVSAGNMGSTRRFSYTVMGDSVNQAARFEPANKDYGTDIMIGESTYELASEKIEARLLDKIVVKGKTVPIRIYELLGRKGELADDKKKVVELYEKALKLHWYRQFDKSLGLLNDALVLVPGDSPCRALQARIEGYLRNPPPREWQGEYIRTSKD